MRSPLVFFVLVWWLSARAGSWVMGGDTAGCVSEWLCGWWELSPVDFDGAGLLLSGPGGLRVELCFFGSVIVTLYLRWLSTWRSTRKEYKYRYYARVKSPLGHVYDQYTYSESCFLLASPAPHTS